MLTTIMTCAGLLGGFMSSPTFDIPKTKIEGKTPLTLRAAKEKDVAPTTDLIHSAYGYWVDNGVKVSPATQSVEKTRSHLSGGLGFIATDANGEIKATFSLDEAQIGGSETAVIVQTKYVKSQIEFIRVDGMLPISGRYLEFKKLAVAPELFGQGIGRTLYDIAEEYARTRGYDGVVLETVKEATWLYDWYIGMGFKVVGKYVYPNSKFETLLLAKKF